MRLAEQGLRATLTVLLANVLLLRMMVVVEGTLIRLMAPPDASAALPVKALPLMESEQVGASM